MKELVSHHFPALRAENPLGLFAALGLLRLLDEASLPGMPPPKLAFAEDFSAILTTHLSVAGVLDAAESAARAQSDSRVLQFAHDKDGNELRADQPGARRDLKASEKAARNLLCSARAHSNRCEAEIAASFFSEVVQDNNGNTKPTAFYFTAGQQLFLKMVEELRTGLTRELLQEALFGPWRYESTLPSLSWDSGVARMYALRAVDPSSEKRGSVPGAYWLAVQALPFFPVYPRATQFKMELTTTGVLGGWKTSQFTWPAWSVPASVPTVRSLLRTDLTSMTAEMRAALGVSAVFSADITRSDQGGYGAFLPARVLPPRDDTPRTMARS